MLRSTLSRNKYILHRYNFLVKSLSSSQISSSLALLSVPAIDLQCHNGGKINYRKAIGPLRIGLGVIPGNNADNANWVRSICTGIPRFASEPTQQTIDQSLLRLDSEIRKTGRINRREIEEILEDMREMKSATSSQSLMIIRCCGELVPEEVPENRTRLVQEIWKTMENLNVPMDISHYNALLRVYLENEYKFNPTEFLQQLSNKGIEPNRVTYQRLIARFCQDGDIDGASTILQHMKEQQLPINAHVFNALILGHSHANDMVSAEGILGVMKQAGLEPNDDTYATLMLGYAKKGDIENIQRIVKECEQKDIYLIDRDFLEIIFTLANSKHENLIDEIIPHLRKQVGFNQEVTNTILRLVTIGQEEVAYKLLKCMTRLVRQGHDEPLPSGNFFLKQMIQGVTPSEKIIKFCQTMISEGVHKYALSRATELALSLQKFEKASDFIEAMHEGGYPIRQHYFWPMFAKSTCEKDVYDGLKSMLYSGLSPTSETLRDYVIPALLSHGKGKEFFEDTLDKLSSYTKIPLSSSVPAALQYILQEGNMKQACQLALKYRLRFHQPFIRRPLVEAYIKTKDAHSLVRIVASSGFDNDENAREAVGIVLMELLDVVRVNKAPLLMPILKELLENGVGLSNSGAELIQNNLGEEATPEITNTIIQLTSPELVPKLSLFQYQKRKPTTTTESEELTTSEMELILADSVKAGRTNKGLQKALFINYCREKNFKKVDDLYEELKKQDFLFTIGMKALLLELYSSCDQLDKAKVIFKQIVEDGLDAPLDDTKILGYVRALVGQGEYEEALQVVKSEGQKDKEVEDNRRSRSTFPVNALTWKILHTLAEKGEVEKVQEMFQTLRSNGYGQANALVLGPLVKAYLVKDDVDGALTEFERCVNEFNTTPLKQELFCRFIKAEDPERLQKVLDLSTKQHGEVNSLYDLVFAFLECGKVRQAKKILETPGLRTRNEKLELTCQRYYEDGRISELENLIEITKDLFNVDRNSLYFYLLKSYCKNGDVDKALSVWTSLQEENVQASPDLLIFLADFLRENKRDVPFVVPSPVSANKLEPGEPARTSRTEEVIEKKDPKNPNDFDYNLDTNNLDKALQIKQTMDADGKYLSVRQFSRLIEKLARAERIRDATIIAEQVLDGGLHPMPRVLHYLLGRLAASGDVEALNRFDSKLSNELKRRTLFNSRLCVGHVNAGKGKEYFENVIKKEVSALLSGEKTSDESTIPSSASTYILLRNEEILPEFEDLAAKTSEKGSKNLYNALWSYYMLKKQIEKANQIWDKELQNTSHLYYKSVSINAVTSNDEELIKVLHEKISSSANISDNDKGSVASSRIQILCSKDKPEQALEVLNKQLESIGIDNFHYNAVTTLKSKLEAKSLPFPHDIPKKTQRRRRKDESSSSSDSDSD